MNRCCAPTAHNTRARLKFGILAILLLALLPANAALQRWAIISAGQGEEAALCDLATAELSGVAGLALVEREALRQLTDEQLLSNALSAEGAASRLQLGRMLRADALLVVKLGGESDSRVLTVIVIDCLTGTRLRIEQFPWKAANMPALAGHLRDLVAAVRQQFTGGITKIVGVPNFLSRSFSRQFDPLQESYSLLLQQVLMLEPGVAVIDTSEAEAIGRELAIGGQPGVERVLPVMVQGEFRVETPPGAAPAVTLSVKLSDKTGVIGTAESGPLPLENAPAWITTALPAKVLAGQANAKPLSTAEQAKLLANQAETFAKLGSFDQSIPLRESVLLLNPDLSPQRVVLIDEYLRRSSLLHSRVFYDRINADGRYTPEAERAQTYLVSAYLRALEHAEITARKWQVHPWQVDKMLGNLVLFPTRLRENVRGGMEPAQPPGIQLLMEAEKAQQRFVLSIIPVIYANLADSKLQSWEYDGVLLSLHVKVSDLILQSRVGHGLSRDRLPYIRRAAELIPANTLSLLLPDFYEERPRFPAEMTEGEYLNFVTDLAGSANPLVSALGRYKLMVKRFHSIKGDKAGLTAMQAELDQLCAELNTNPASKGNHAATTFKLRGDIAQALNKLNTPPPAPPANICAVIFTKFRLTEDPPTGLRDMRLVPCKGFDVVWWMSGCRLFLHQQAGILTPVTLPKDVKAGALLDVVWDGRLIWVATQSQGVWVFDADGHYLGAAFTAEGVLPYDQALTLYPIAPGRILAVGVSTKNQRAWCAAISWEDNPGEATVKVFHEALESPAGSTNPTRYAQNPSSTFTRFKFVRLDGVVPGDGPVVGISRWLNMPGTNWYLDPLTIELNTLKVGVWTPQTGLQELTRFEPELLVSPGGILGFDNNHRPNLRLTMAASGQKPAYRPITVSNPGDASRQQNTAEKRFPTQVIITDSRFLTILQGADGWIYLTGLKWWRIDPKTLTAQRLTTLTLPKQYYELTQVGVSSLLGLLAWNNTGCYRVTIDETKIPKAGE
jgi:hypothetical protein